jgi:hypothetical protein
MTDQALAVASEQFGIAANRLSTFKSLGQEWSRLLNLLEEDVAEDEIADQDERILAELKQVAGDIRVKAHGLAVVYQALKVSAENLKAEQDAIYRLRKAREAHAERLRQYALGVMQEMGEERIEAGRYTLAVRLNNPHVEVLDESVIPEDFWRVPEPPPPEVDKTAILRAAKDGVVVPGVAIVRTPRLDVR